MKYITFIIILFSITLVSSCKVEPKEINYGTDHCLYCDMTVVDKGHSAEYVTKKGRAYMFDAVECLVGQVLKLDNEADLEYILVADYLDPGTLINAKEAIYLISEKIKSPMGANLSALSSKVAAEELQLEFGGDLFSWDELKQKLGPK